MFKTNDYTNSLIVAKTSSNIFTYNIIQIGTYPNKDILVFTAKPNQYRVSHNYIVETTFRSNQSQKIITCSIQYQDKKPEFMIEFIYNNNTKIRKPFDNLSNSMQLKHNKQFGNQFLDLFKQQVLQTFNQEDDVLLEELIFSV
ncbi:17472_t:CDS:2, partial [Cetraspora pellucida]